MFLESSHRHHDRLHAKQKSAWLFTFGSPRNCFVQLFPSWTALQPFKFKAIRFSLVQFWPSADPSGFQVFSVLNHQLEDLFNASILLCHRIPNFLLRMGQQYSQTSSMWHPSLQHSCTMSVDELAWSNRRRKLMAFLSSASTDPTQRTNVTRYNRGTG